MELKWYTTLVEIKWLNRTGEITVIHLCPELWETVELILFPYRKNWPALLNCFCWRKQQPSTHTKDHLHTPSEQVYQDPFCFCDCNLMILNSMYCLCTKNLSLFLYCVYVSVNTMRISRNFSQFGFYILFLLENLSSYWIKTHTLKTQETDTAMQNNTDTNTTRHTPRSESFKVQE